MMVLSISCGAVIGALSRYYMMRLIISLVGTAFPWATLVVNGVGSFGMGVIMAYIALKLSVSQDMQGFLTVGFLGSFTTFSAASLDAVSLIQRGDIVLAMGYMLLSVSVGITALAIGSYMTRVCLSI